jgi:hypothetical protein
MVNGEGVVKREGRVIQRRSIWCVGLSGLSRLSRSSRPLNQPNQIDRTNETDQSDQIHWIPATRNVGSKDRNSLVDLQLVKG